LIKPEVGEIKNTVILLNTKYVIKNYNTWIILSLETQDPRIIDKTSM
jgi:hypothetical protein